MNENIYIYPTDTVWGIGCNIFSQSGLIEIARIKRTDANKPLSILFSDLNELKEYFDFSLEFNDKNLLKLMSMEVTLLLPKNKLKKKLDQFITQNSEYISIRIIQSEFIKSMRNEIGAPFYTTSLNISGQAPILDWQSAVSFQSQFCPKAIVKNESSKDNLSGTSSTIIQCELENVYKIIRAGRNVSEIKPYLESLNLF